MPNTANRVPLTPLSFLERVRLAYPDKLAVVEPGGTMVSYAELSRDCDTMAGALRASGLRRGERAAVLDLNTRWLLAAHFAIPGAGAALVALNTRLAATEYRDILAHSGAKFCWCRRQWCPGWKQILLTSYRPNVSYYCRAPPPMPCPELLPTANGREARTARA